MPGACHSPTCPVPSCQEPVILSPVQCRHARSLSFSHLSSAIMPGVFHSPTCPVPSCQEPIILPPVLCCHARSLSFSHLSSAVMPGACHFPTCPVPSCQRWSFQRWNSGQQMSLITLRRLHGQHRWTLVTEGEKHGEGGLFDFLFYSKPCTRSLCRLLCFYTLSGCTLDGEKRESVDVRAL